MIRMVVINTVALLFAIAAVKCQSSETPTGNIQLINKTWKLESFEWIGKHIDRIRNNREYSIQFLADSIAIIQADCNRNHGRYWIVAQEHVPQITWGVMRTTGVGCGPESRGEEFMRALGKVTTYEIRRDVLRIFYDHNTKVLNFRYSREILF